MARVKRFQRQNLHNARPHPTETECHYLVFDHGGRRYLQISSAGSRERKSSGVTQTYQFDVARARELKRIIGKAFPELA